MQDRRTIEKGVFANLPFLEELHLQCVGEYHGEEDLPGSLWMMDDTPLSLSDLNGPKHEKKWPSFLHNRKDF